MVYLLGLPVQMGGQESGEVGARARIKASMRFHASFDRGMEAELAQGDPSIYTRTSTQPEETVRRGLHTQGKTNWSAQGGLKGGAALHFTDRDAAWIFYRGEENVAYKKSDWEGTISLWLRLDPEEDLAPGYADPLQLTTRAWNDAAFFVDFNQDGNPRDFRLGAFADLQVWNPENKDLAESERPLLPVKAPPFSRDAWTHVCFTWSDFNSGDRGAIARLYLNGKDQGQITGWDQRFTWKPEEAMRLYLGLNYIGWLDEVSSFDRCLDATEIQWVFRNPGELLP